jgi:adenylate cyclase
MALFGEGADSAVAAAVCMLQSLSKFNEERKAEGKGPVAIGVGINTGRLTMGTIGGPSQLKCSVIGDAVNLAARIESLTKSYGVPLLVGNRTVERLSVPEAHSLRKVDVVQVVGKTEPATLYEVFDADPPELFDAKKETLAKHAEALRLYHDRDFANALRLFRECEKRLPNDVILKRYIKRATDYQRQPPSKDWTGIEYLTSK